MGEQYEWRDARRQPGLNPSLNADVEKPQTVAQSTSPLFHLPREIRDQIFELALGPSPNVLEHDELTIIATPAVPLITATSADTDTDSKGIPELFLSCKQVCSEALEVFGNTRYFIAKEEDVRFARPKTYMNPLVFSPNLVRDIALPATKSDQWDTKLAQAFFLRALVPFQFNALSLETSWLHPYIIHPGTGKAKSPQFDLWWK